MRNPETRPASSEAFQQKRRRQIEARLKLAFLPRYDALIDSYHRLPERTDLSVAAIEAWRERRRREYRRATGVAIEQRDELKRRLEEAAETGAASVEEIVAELRIAYRNGSSTEPSAPADGGASPEDWL